MSTYKIWLTNKIEWLQSGTVPLNIPSTKYGDYSEKRDRRRRREEEKKKKQNQILRSRVELLSEQFKRMKMKKSTGVYALTDLKSDIKDLSKEVHQHDEDGGLRDLVMRLASLYKEVKEKLRKVKYKEGFENYYTDDQSEDSDDESEYASEDDSGSSNSSSGDSDDGDDDESSSSEYTSENDNDEDSGVPATPVQMILPEFLVTRISEYRAALSATIAGYGAPIVYEYKAKF